MEWLVAGKARRPETTTGERFPLLRNRQGRYVLLVDGEHVRVPQRWARHHDITLDQAAVALGRRTSDKKARAARVNGRKGGRPPKKVV